MVQTEFLSVPGFPFIYRTARGTHGTVTLILYKKRGQTMQDSKSAFEASYHEFRKQYKICCDEEAWYQKILVETIDLALSGNNLSGLVEYKDGAVGILKINTRKRMSLHDTCEIGFYPQMTNEDGTTRFTTSPCIRYIMKEPDGLLDVLKKITDECKPAE